MTIIQSTTSRQKINMMDFDRWWIYKWLHHLQKEHTSWWRFQSGKNRKWLIISYSSPCSPTILVFKNTVITRKIYILQTTQQLCVIFINVSNFFWFSLVSILKELVRDSRLHSKNVRQNKKNDNDGENIPSWRTSAILKLKDINERNAKGIRMTNEFFLLYFILCCNIYGEVANKHV